MDNFLKLLIILWGIFLLFLFYEIFDYLRFKFYLKKISKKPCWCKNELSKIDLYNKLPSHLKDIMEYKIKRFITEKTFIPRYLELSEEMKIMTAFYACLPTLAYKNFCYPSLKYIYIYPHTIIKKHIEQYNGIIQKEMLISGESVGDSVIIAWDEAKRDIFKYKKRNVIIHEFAHELDFEDGMIDGIPVFAHNDYKHFQKIFNETYKKTSKEKIIDDYAYTNYAEFLAVTTEYFFLKSNTLKTHYPELYEEYKKIFKFDPEILNNS